MKTQEEIEKLAFLEYPRLINDPYNPMEDDNTYERKIWIGAYTQCQEDFAHKKYTEEDLHTILKLRKEWYSHTDTNVVRDFIKQKNMKIIKITEEHYVAVDYSKKIEINDKYLTSDNRIVDWHKEFEDNIKENRPSPITHSTQPIETYFYEIGGATKVFGKIKELSLQEAKEIIGITPKLSKKRYTEEDLLHAFREGVLLPNSQIGIMEDIFKQVVESLNKQD